MYKLEHVLTGIPGLDQMTCGGFPKNSTIMLRGGSGTCKTNFCIQYLYMGATKYKEPGVMISFAESKNQVVQHGLSFGWDLEELENKGLFTVVRYEPHELLKITEGGGGSIRDTVESLGAKRIVIDSLTEYEMLFEKRYRTNESILNLFEMLRSWDTTTVVTSESPVSPNIGYKGRSGFLSDGIIQLYSIRQGLRRTRALEIVKMRDTCHTDQIRTFTIDKDGIKIGKELKNVPKN